MTARPPIAADVSAALTAAIPPRLLKRLDAEPMLAEKWTWTTEGVTTDKGETVTFTLAEGVITGVTCSCLLAPKCLHIAAVITRSSPTRARLRTGRVRSCTCGRDRARRGDRGRRPGGAACVSRGV